MLVKSPKPSGYRKILIKGAKVLFVVEGVCFIGCYAVFNKLNTDRDFRNTTRQKFPFVLETYYWIDEKLGQRNTREIDYKHWAAE